MFYPVADLKKAANSGCVECLVVLRGLATTLEENISPDYVVRYKTGQFGELRIRIMKESDWSTRQKFEMYLGRGRHIIAPGIVSEAYAGAASRPSKIEQAFRRDGELPRSSL